MLGVKPEVLWNAVSACNLLSRLSSPELTSKAWVVAQLVEGLPNMLKALGLGHSSEQPGQCSACYKPNTWELEAEGSKPQGYPWVHSKFMSLRLAWDPMKEKVEE